MNLLRASLVSLAVLSAAATACSATTEAPADSTDDSAAAFSSGPIGNPDPASPTTDPSAMAQAVWSSHDYDYLPWQYSPDGCFDRSFYMSMEFASRGIPVREQVINVRWNKDNASNKAEFEPIDQEGNPVQYGGKVVKWQYHIAAVLVPGPNVNIDAPMVIDRALEPGPVSVDKWISDANSAHMPQESTPTATLTKDDHGFATKGYDEFKTRGAPYVGVGPFLTGNWVSYESDPDNMPVFDANTIKTACDTLWTIWVDCIGADADQTTSMLQDKTNALMTALQSRNELTNWNGQPLVCERSHGFTCGSHAAPHDAGTP